jgi:5-methyltetrahydrofolate--homocysteine methyltransferase
MGFRKRECLVIFLQIKEINMSDLILKIYDGVMEGDSSVVKEAVSASLDAHLDPERILNEGMISAMTEVGRLFEEGEYFVPEMLVAARAMQSGLSLLRPALAAADVKSKGKVAIGTVKGDLHDIGKNLVSMMLEGAGYEVVDLGIDISPEQFIEAVQSDDFDVVALSALLTTTIVNMETTIQAFSIAGIRENIKIVVGGAPVTDDFAKKIGADGYAPDASQAVKVINSLMGF